MTETPLTIGNFKIYCVSATPVKKQVLRTWKERLSFSKDELFFWNPFNKYKTVMEYVDIIEDGKTLINGNNIYCNERTFEKFKGEFSGVSFSAYSNVNLGGYIPTTIDFMDYSPYREVL